MSRRKTCNCGMAPRLPGIDECRACRNRLDYRHAHKVLRLAKAGHMDRTEALDEARVVREDVRSRRGAA